MRIHPIFPPEKLRKAANDPLPGQQEDPGEPVVINDEQEWEVEQVLASRLFRASSNIVSNGRVMTLICNGIQLAT